MSAMTTAHIAAVCDAVDGQIVPKLMEAIALAGLATTCGKGCFHCCREAVEACKGEAEYALEGLSPEARAAVAERTRRWLTIVKASGGLTEPRSAMYATRWREMKAWCPFLENGECSVYERRPVACRTFYALNDPKFCEPDGRPQQRFATSIETAGYTTAALLEDQGWVAHDHLGLWLAEILLGKSVRSARAQEMRVTLTPSENPPPVAPGEQPWMDANVEVRPVKL